MTCSECGQTHTRTGQRHCTPCHNAYMRAWRKRNPPTEEQRRRGITRAYTKMLVKRGHMRVEPCAVCRAVSPVEAHHPDYARPRLVVWLCRAHHKELHLDTLVP